MKKLISITLALLLSLTLTLCLCSCSETETPDTGTTAAEETSADAQTEKAVAYTEDTELGKGAKTFTFKVRTDDGEITFTVHSDASTVGQALIENGLISGEDGAYGLYVKIVNGVTADFDKDGAYWAFYEGDALAVSGVDMTTLTDGGEYGFVYTK